MRNIMVLLFVLSLLVILACNQKEPVTPNSQSPAEIGSTEESDFEVEALAAEFDGGFPVLAKKGHVVEVPAGSNDALAAAIAEAGPQGYVLLRSGHHSESETVVISHPVKIVGEHGAVLQVDTQPWTGIEAAVDPALYVLNTSQVVIWGLEIRPAGEVGGAAIWLENAPQTVIAKNRIYNHQMGIFNSNGDFVKIWRNTVVASPAGFTGALPVTLGILSASGERMQVTENDVSTSVFGIFVSDRKGNLAKNTAHGNAFGIILCTLQPTFPAPNGELISSDVPATQWKAIHNNAHDNFDVGYLVIDGANDNVLINNAASNNRTAPIVGDPGIMYDMELTGLTSRLGFIDLPACFDNKVIAGRFQEILVKDCGDNNTVIGGSLVDTVADPCL